MKTFYRGKIFTFNHSATLANIQGLVPDSLFVDEEHFTFLRDGLIAVENGKISAIGDYNGIKHQICAEDQVVDYSNKLITPGFIDAHMHATQTSAVSAYGEKLLTWLNNYVFPSEVAFKSDISARREYEILLKQLFKNGTTSICAYLPTSYDGADLISQLGMMETITPLPSMDYDDYYDEDDGYIEDEYGVKRPSSRFSDSVYKVKKKNNSGKSMYDLYS